MKTVQLYPDRKGTLIVIGDIVELDGLIFDVELNPHDGEVIISGDTGAANLSEVHNKCLVVGHDPLQDAGANIAFSGDKFFTFQPEDLHNKTLKILIGEDSGIISVTGLDEKTGNVYLITTLMRKDDTQ